ncbi:retrotransposon hot spot (RHS) protein [Trypanosoma cruzi Dm28c]|uniref:Retrotransposon hot spot (RHS) protein n=2 Tax=Trypanosoma cruzi TaxID=5693 RepID=V5AN91_TRYCR|nr:retrotransposon hot spot (RHS) protein [Trypanosoma cruzi Dm28c]PWU84454.1 putative retrotransposon hot spot protein (RHS,) [Trypanosoma cruzi]PWU85504.1 putative retrotransposon hot spot protein (RHS,) [Trypanosoma cruzi]
MSGRPEEGLYGNVESQSSNVSQGGRRRARSEFESDTDYSSATRRRLEGMYRPQWTMSSTVEDILLEGSTNRNEMRLNDFLRRYLGDEWVVKRNGNVTMGNFVQNPETFIKKKRLLSTIKALPSYQALEAIYKLHHEGVFFLRQWRDYEGKDTVSPPAKGTLDAALSRVQTSTSVVKSTVLKGYYESVYNASWHHVVEIPDGEGTGMKVEEGKPKQSWTYRAVGGTREEDDGVQQSAAERLRLMVLAWDDGWPYTMNGPHRAGNDLCVNCEVERVWQIVKRGSALTVRPTLSPSDVC